MKTAKNDDLLSRTHRQFIDPPREFGPIPFWLWNDDVREKELLRQLREFHRAGFGGVVPHPRTGLSKRVGYLTDEYFRLLRRVVEEAARLGMKIILYDEGGYPSGSAKGAVVAENPEFASQALGLWEKEVVGAWSGFWRPNTGRALLDRHVCTLLGRVGSHGRILPETIVLLEPRPHTIFKVDVPRGRWKVMSLWHTASGGHIRGVFPEEEDGHATAPPSADLLNPRAVACFLRLTHDRYYRHLGRFFGGTIVAMFTDEPSVLGREPRRPDHPRPFTPGLVQWLARRWKMDPRPWLPSLWLDYGKGTDEFRGRYDMAIRERLQEVFYGAQSRWCADHGIALTGHPQWSNELSAQRYFQMPGQDMVWRWVTPGSASSMEGADSVAAKSATSGARLAGRRRILTEIGGAYGWQFSLDEMKWLYDWHLVRGNNLLCPHAAFYSIRDRRAWESEPDMGVHNVWWPYFHFMADYGRRISWLLCDGLHVCDVAVLGNGQALPWKAARALYRNQIDFLYVEEKSVAGSRLDGDRLIVGTQGYRAIVIDGDPPLTGKTRRRLRDFRKNGGVLIPFRGEGDLIDRLDVGIDRDLRLRTKSPDLRFIHYRKNHLDFYFLTNEGERSIRGDLTLRARGAIERWDPMTGERHRLQVRMNGPDPVLPVFLERRASTVLVVDSRQPLAESSPIPRSSERSIPLRLEWKVSTLAGKPVPLTAPGDWSRQRGFELFSGTLVYRASVEIPEHDGEIGIDLGGVGDIAEVLLDGQPVGVRMWPPYRVRLGRRATAGSHRLEVRVTNSMANAYEGIQRPSGLLSASMRLIVSRG